MLTSSLNLLKLAPHCVLAVAKKSNWSMLTYGSIAVTVLLLAVGGALVAYLRMRQGSTEDQVRHLFRELCRAHQLTRAQTQLLFRLAQELKLTCPASLFIDNTIWRIPEGCPDKGLAKKDWDKLQLVQRMLFMPPTASEAQPRPKMS